MHSLTKRRFLRVTAIFVALALSLFVAGHASAGKRLERVIDQSGLKRSYIVHLPTNLGSRKSWPVLIALHPAFASAKDFERITQFHAVKGSENFVVVYPNGFRRSWNVGPCCGGAQRRKLDDVGYIKAIMADLGLIAPLQKRVFLTGFSNGAMLVYRLLCDEADMVAAAAPSGAMIRLDGRSCNPSRAVPILHVHGEQDEFAPLNGGQSAFEKVGVQPSVADGVAFFAKKNRCGGTTGSVLTKDVECRNWKGCSGQANVSLCVVPELGHLWPGGRSGAFGGMMGLGPERTDVNVSAAIVQFFLTN